VEVRELTKGSPRGTAKHLVALNHYSEAWPSAILSPSHVREAVPTFPRRRGARSQLTGEPVVHDMRGWRDARSHASWS